MSIRRGQSGLTLIELIFFIVIVSGALAGVLSVLNVTTTSSADPLVRKTMLAIAQALLEEVQLLPFTYCDQDDANALTATSAVLGATGCATTVELNGPEPGETRSTGLALFDNVNDYHGLTLKPITDVTGNIAPAAGYTAIFSVTNEAGFGPAGLTPPSAAVLRIAVTVTKGGDSFTLEGYRTRYAPNMF